MTEPVGTPDTHITEDTPKFEIMAGHLVVAVGRCTCDGPFDTYGHRPECGYEPVMTLDELRQALRRVGRTVVELPEPTAWRNRLGGDLDIWPIGGWSVTAGGGTVSISTSTDGLGGGLGGFEPDRARAIAAAMLAGTERIERAGGSQVGDQR
jgi:hypothetical protein